MLSLGRRYRYKEGREYETAARISRMQVLQTSAEQASSTVLQSGRNGTKRSHIILRMETFTHRKPSDTLQVLAVSRVHQSYARFRLSSSHSGAEIHPRVSHAYTCIKWLFVSRLSSFRQ